MKWIYGAILTASLAMGGIIGYVTKMSPAGVVFSLAVSGFAASSVIAGIFTWRYFFYQETDTERIQRLQADINQLKQIKRIEHK